MTILEAIQEAHAAAGIAPASLAFAQLQEFNSFMDSFQFSDYPVNVVVPVGIRGTFMNNRVKDIATVRGWMLTRISEDTNNFRSVQIEPVYINPMRVLAKRFLRQLLETDIIDPEVEPVTYTIDPEYMFLTAHLFGVSYSISLPLRDNVC